MYKLIFLITLISISSCSDSSLNFLSMADWGGTDHSPYTHTGERNVAAAMNKIVGNNNY